MPHPHVLLYAAVPLDGHLDTRQGEARLLLSDREDFDRAGSVSGGADAILVGAGTLRADNPRLLVNSPAARLVVGKPEYPFEVTITATGDLAPGWKL
ncbi:dihydrofolate reductase family protein [Streptomyces californicus]|uniref:dihydrofolate reductase family protein n=1 Tax=Streptomyces californicus TaxID=67351 RepID=UPI00369F9CE4